jgi:regulator of protease activity HflC (stomatin/prohibitin superfamily)
LAEAAKSKILLEAQGQAEAIRLTAEAQAMALEMIALQLNKKGGEEAARLALAREYVSMYGEMGQKSNTIMFNERPADANALISQAMMSMTAATSAMKGPALEEGSKPDEKATLLVDGKMISESQENKVDQ